MDRDNTEKLTLQDYEAEGLCSGCMFYSSNNMSIPRIEALIPAASPS